MSLAKLYQYFYHLLAKKDYSQKELRTKALQKGYESSDIEKVISEFIEKKYIDDRRLAENLLLGYQERKGKIWIQTKMLQKGIDSDIIKETLSNFQEPVSEQLKKSVIQKYKIEDWSAIDFSLKQKIQAFLGRRGFSNARSILEKWIQEASE